MIPLCSTRMIEFPHKMRIFLCPMYELCTNFPIKKRESLGLPCISNGLYVRKEDENGIQEDDRLLNFVLRRFLLFFKILLIVLLEDLLEDNPMLATN